MKSEVRNILISKLIAGLVAGFMVVALPLYLTDLGFDLYNIGAIFGVATLFYAFLVFYLGVFSDSSGRKWIGLVSIAGLMASSFIFGLLVFIPITIAIAAFIASKILFELSEAIFRNISKIRILDLSKKNELGVNYGWLLFSQSGGYGIGMLFGALFLSLTSFNLIFFILGVILVFAMFFFSGSGDIFISKRKEKIAGLSDLAGTSKIFRLVLLINTLLVFGTFFVDFFALPLFQREVLGMTNIEIFLLLGIVWVIYAPFNYIGGKLYDRYGNTLFIIALFMISVTSVLLAFVRNIFLFSLLLLFDYVLFGITDPPRYALSGLVSREKKGLFMSFFEFFSTLAVAITLLFFGKLVELLGFEFVFFVRGAVHFLSIFCVIYLVRLLRNKNV